jgi:hypothetical protein
VAKTSLRNDRYNRRRGVRFSKLWTIVLAIWLVLWGVFAMGWLTMDSGSDILGIGAIIAGVLLALDK